MIEITGRDLTLEQIEQVARYREKTYLSEKALAQVNQSRAWVEEIVNADKPVYGINTGYGIFSDRRINKQDARKLARNLVLSHAVGTGDPFPEDVVRAAIVIRANTLAKGHSGVRPLLIDRLLDLNNTGVLPLIPEKGSMGSSGDLAPLCHLGLILTRDEEDAENLSGEAVYQGKIQSGKAAMQAAGLERLILQPKEGLALSNGATFSAAVAALCVIDLEYYLKLADAATAMTLEAVKGCSSAFDERLHDARGHRGQIESARRIRENFQGSNLVDAAGRVQDAYSIRCAPQVHGSGADALAYVRRTVETEVNAVTDNPLLFEAGGAISGGNFHGEPVAQAMDALKIAAAEVGAISERRIFRLLDGNLNSGLPSMLVDSQMDAGLNSGLMMLQYTAASLVLENQALATPDSVFSLPTSANQEDHNANSMNAARHARTILENLKHILATEFFTASRALTQRLRENPQTCLGVGTGYNYGLIREKVPYEVGDTYWRPALVTIKSMIDHKELAA
ncbi:MAG: histidine ammonia-lyase [Leptolinea sp.]|jgi:histidine ammonia-lyase|nr:histidine ammonia-lyase [Leptolinea sp.]